MRPINDWLARQPRQTTGYLCPRCAHVWDGFSAPCPIDVVVAHYELHGRQCPSCESAGGILLLTSEEYRRRLAGRDELGNEQ
jgi:hypothetical protein